MPLSDIPLDRVEACLRDVESHNELVCIQNLIKRWPDVFAALAEPRSEAKQQAAEPGEYQESNDALEPSCSSANQVKGFVATPPPASAPPQECWLLPTEGLLIEGDQYWNNDCHWCSVPQSVIGTVKHYPLIRRRVSPPTRLPERAREIICSLIQVIEHRWTLSEAREIVDQADVYLSAGAASEPDNTGYEVATEWRCRAAKSASKSEKRSRD